MLQGGLSDYLESEVRNVESGKFGYHDDSYLCSKGTIVVNTEELRELQRYNQDDQEVSLRK